MVVLVLVVVVVHGMWVASGRDVVSACVRVAEVTCRGIVRVC